jgi:hypothetical protein
MVVSVESAVTESTTGARRSHGRGDNAPHSATGEALGPAAALAAAQVLTGTGRGGWSSPRFTPIGAAHTLTSPIATAANENVTCRRLNPSPRNSPRSRHPPSWHQLAELQVNPSM